jgi:16S rRNA (guanine527-N7)-methyltransferase
MPAALALKLQEGLTALGLESPASAQAALLQYLALLEKWNRTFNLTSIREPERMLTHHLLDALAVLPHLPPAAGLRVLDVGSGGGVPGIPWAIARPDWQCVLVDSNRKKTAFLTQAAIELGLANLQIRDSRVEALPSNERYDIVTSRAFSDLAMFARLGAPLAVPGGMLAALKGEVPDAEIAALPADICVSRIVPLVVPGLHAARHLVVLQSRSLPA